MRTFKRECPFSGTKSQLDVSKKGKGEEVFLKRRKLTAQGELRVVKPVRCSFEIGRSLSDEQPSFHDDPHPKVAGRDHSKDRVGDRAAPYRVPHLLGGVTDESEHP